MLVGMMGAGKTTTGRAVAEALGWPFLDSDRQVEERAGRTVAQIWAAEGEPAFRVLESQVLAEAMTAVDAGEPAVIAAAGGTVLDPASRALLRAHPPVVWLRARPATSAARVGRGGARPLLSGHPAVTLVRLAAERDPLYEEVATAVVDVDDLTPVQVVECVLAAVGMG